MSTPSTIRVLVKAEHIAAAGQGAHNDPTALAIRDRLAKQKPKEVLVWKDTVRIDGKCYTLPPACNHATGVFLRTGTCEPFEFQLSNQPLPLP